MLSAEQLDEVERIIEETPITTLFSFEEDNIAATLRDAARRVREYLTPLNQGDGT